jgi:hypothetical protein
LTRRTVTSPTVCPSSTTGKAECRSHGSKSCRNRLTVADAGTVTGPAVMISRTATVRNRDCTTTCWFSAVAALVRNQPRIMNHSQL